MIPEEWHQRLIEFAQQVETVRAALPHPPQWAAALQEAVAGMETSLEELSLAEEERQQHQMALAEAQQATTALAQWYQALFDLAPDGYLVTDTHGIVQELNQAAASLLAIRQDYAVGKPMVLFVVPEERRAFRTWLTALSAPPRRQACTVRLQPREGR